MLSSANLYQIFYRSLHHPTLRLGHLNGDVASRCWNKACQIVDTSATSVAVWCGNDGASLDSVGRGGSLPQEQLALVGAFLFRVGEREE